MGRTLVLLLILSVSLVNLSCTQEHTSSQSDFLRLKNLYDSKNYFELRDQLNNQEKSNKSVALFFEAALEKAFNNPINSNQLIAQALDLGLVPDSLQVELQMMKMNNHLRLHEYDKLLRAAEKILEVPNLSKEQKKDISNTRLIAKALQGIPSQKITKSGDSEIVLTGTHFDVNINGHERDYAYDTGANYSILMKSEAESLDLIVREVGIDVGTATGKQVKGDIAVADSLIIGNMTFEHVIFLIFPDEALTFPGGFKLHGLIGFPVLEAMKELQFHDGKIFVPENPVQRNIQNLALDGLTPLIEFKYKGNELVGSFDTGANKTVFFKPFFQNFLADNANSTSLDTVKSGGVGGVVAHPVYNIGRINIELSNSSILLQNVYAHTETLKKDTEDQLYANIGLDVLGELDRYILNFEEMALIIE